jgi:hypothetical protein
MAGTVLAQNVSGLFQFRLVDLQKFATCDTFTALASLNQRHRSPANQVESSKKQGPPGQAAYFGAALVARVDGVLVSNGYADEELLTLLAASLAGVDLLGAGWLVTRIWAGSPSSAFTSLLSTAFCICRCAGDRQHQRRGYKI